MYTSQSVSLTQSISRGLFLESPYNFSGLTQSIENLVGKLLSTCFEKLIFEHVFNVRKTERIAKSDGLETRRCEHIKGIVPPEIDSKRAQDLNQKALNKVAKLKRTPYDIVQRLCKPACSHYAAGQRILDIT